ncbi:surface-adhesin E family protein [Undibacterium sp. Ji42W]|uniref:surface-adhesin E family protein n=1 Tax=Undibacterium sp. Ji42W TaxID=3413039 RepID=UPI003BF2564F
MNKTMLVGGLFLAFYYTVSAAASTSSGAVPSRFTRISDSSDGNNRSATLYLNTESIWTKGNLTMAEVVIEYDLPYESNAYKPAIKSVVLDNVINCNTGEFDILGSTSRAGAMGSGTTPYMASENKFLETHKSVEEAAYKKPGVETVEYMMVGLACKFANAKHNLPKPPLNEKFIKIYINTEDNSAYFLNSKSIETTGRFTFVEVILEHATPRTNAAQTISYKSQVVDYAIDCEVGELGFLGFTAYVGSMGSGGKTYLTALRPYLESHKSVREAEFRRTEEGSFGRHLVSVVCKTVNSKK